MDANVEPVVVLDQVAHGMSAERCADELRERLPGVEVALAETRRDALDLVPDAPIVVGLKPDDEVLAAAESLRLFACGYAGIDHLPLDDLRARGVAVTNAAGVHAPGIAEQVFGSIFEFTRRLDRGRRQQERREWRRYPSAGEVQGATVTVVGQGAIGTTIVERANAFEAHTVAVRHSPEKGGPADAVHGYDAMPDVLVDADFLVLACPLTETTEKLIDARAFDALSPESVLINVARGGVVDTGALVTALRKNRIRAAALDVTDPEPLPEDHPLWTFGNVRITPHMAGHTPRYWERVAGILVRNVERVRDGGSWGDPDLDLENQVV